MLASLHSVLIAVCRDFVHETAVRQNLTLCYRNPFIFPADFKILTSGASDGKFVIEFELSDVPNGNHLAQPFLTSSVRTNISYPVCILSIELTPGCC